MATPENRPHSLPTLPLSQSCPTGKIPPSPAPFSPLSTFPVLGPTRWTHSHASISSGPGTRGPLGARWGPQHQWSQKQLLLCRSWGKQIRERRTLQLPCLALLVTIHTIALGPPLSGRSSPTSGLPSTASILSLFSLPQSPWPWSHSHQAKTFCPKPSILLLRASPSLTHLLRPSGVVSGFRVVMFSAKRDREEKRRRFESTFYTQALYWMFVSCQNPYFKIHSLMWWLDHEGVALMNGLVPL